MSKAIIKDNVVVELFAPFNGFKLDECFPDGLINQMVDIPEGVGQGWTKDGTNWLSPDEMAAKEEARWSAEEAEKEYNRLRDPDERIAELEAIRYEKQHAGVTVDGVSVKTDSVSINVLADIASRNIAYYPVDYKAVSGWIEITSPDSAAMLNSAQTTHVQACFTREKELYTQITKLIKTPDKLAALDLSTGWPG